MNASGAVMMERNLGLPLGGSALAAAVTDSGRWVVAGQTNTAVAGKTVPFIVGLSDALDSDCNAEARCEGKTQAGCTDNNPCTLDVCDLIKGCTHLAVIDGYACDDGDKCTVGDGCAAGTCKAGSGVACDDGNLCTSATCDSKIGCMYINLSGTPCVGGSCDGAGGCAVRPDVPTHGSAANYAMYINGTTPYPRLDAYGYNLNGILANVPAGLSSPVEVPYSADVRVVAVGSTSTCLIDGRGALSCVGYPGNVKAVLTQPIDLGAPVAWVAARQDTFCALTIKDEIWCWTGKILPVKERGPPATGSWAGVAVGGDHACAWQPEGGAICWGVGSFGQLGGGTQPSTKVAATAADPVLIASDSSPLTKVTAMCAGDLFTCARTSDSVVHCWGHDLYGQLGDQGGSISSKAKPVFQTGGGASSFTNYVIGAQSVHCGADFACVTAENPTQANPNKFVEKTVCWGRGDRGQLGNGAVKNSNKPVQVQSSTGAAILPGGRWFGNGETSICLRKGADGLCWGSNEGGVLGLFGANGVPDPKLPSTPIVADTLKPLAARTLLRGAAGLFCATDAADNDVCWGRNDGGGLAAGDAAGGFDYASVVVMAGGSALLSRSPNIGCERKPTAIACWGDNRFGYALGFLVGGSGSYIKTPTQLPSSAGATRLITGKNHSCATIGVYPGDALYCWGRNQNGELGRGSSGGALGFAAVTMAAGGSFLGVKDFALSSNRTCALDSGGYAWCWGQNQYGEAGTAAGANVTSPVKVSTIQFSKIAVANGQTCAIEDNAGKAIWCWGYNGGTNSNYLGGKDAVSSTPLPVKVAWPDPFVDLAMSDGQWTSSLYASTTCAVTATGSVVCWGEAGTGALGNGATSTSQSSLPLATPNINDATSIAAGDRAFCVLRTDKTVACWGQRAFGQTGRGASGAYTAINPFP